MTRAVTYSAAAKRSTRTGFTLLEVLLALGLSTILLAVMMAAVSLNLKAFDAGRTTTERAQLARSVLNRISQDLRGVSLAAAEKQAVASDKDAPPPFMTTSPVPAPTPPPSNVTPFVPRSIPPNPTPPSEDEPSAPAVPGVQGADYTSMLPSLSAPGTSAWPVSLEGDAHSLTICTVHWTPSAPLTELALVNEPPADSLPEARLVCYAIDTGQLDTADNSGEEHTPGLVRAARPWHPAPRDRQGGTPQQSTTTPSGGTSPLADFASGGAPGVRQGNLSSLSQQDDAIEWLSIPEVKAIAFRYWDSNSWSTSWNSQERHGLPAAIEVLLAVEPVREARESVSEADSMPQSADDLVREATEALEAAIDAEEGQTLSSVETTGTRWAVYRLVVGMPAAHRDNDASESLDPIEGGVESPTVAPATDTPSPMSPGLKRSASGGFTR